MAFVWAILSSVIYGTADFMGGLAGRRAPVLTATLLSQLVGLAALLIAAPLMGGAPARADLVWGACAGIAGSLGVLLLYHVLATGTVSTAAPLVSMVALCVPVAAGLALGERLGWAGGLGIVAGLLAVALISGAPEAPDAPAAAPGAARRALLIAIAAGLLVGAFLTCLAQVRAGTGLWPLVVARMAGSTTLAAVAAWRRTDLRPPAPALAPIAVAGVADVVANVLYVLAAQHGPMSLIATIVSLAPASTVVLAQLVLREKLGRAQQVGVAVALVAVALLAQGTR